MTYSINDGVQARKTELRHEVLARRDALDPQVRIEGSLAAADHAADCKVLHQTLRSGTVVSGFLPIRSEIDPRPLMADLATKGARLCLPVVISKTQIEFRELGRGAPLVDSGFGTIGPDHEAEVLNPEILLVPLAAFDAQGGRMGYGAGYYDRAIERLGDLGIQPVLIGLAFDVQQVQTVPMEVHDCRLHGIVTNTGFIKATG